ncbi:hypothetical protein COT97_05655 [Candidatus Falkowbacteria bacterium CG10_big_fil_rev_8_21_14_0_10_39_11]|uniref:Uncharacterized protein n=1 Tax=Candidatus Falkowbacteria bacterium CG10_big_fil_rev_8_21_14_0_10_39_11 TaxID=1974565 RepID=A0A2H0V3H8_9BACT|nr:MAG: hypothetical protein COT97_05655 [Candidatus Falkowbacteria bacterium CG10_big_fil_rev_8_21_14_0_10_39_11]
MYIFLFITALKLIIAVWLIIFGFKMTNKKYLGKMFQDNPSGPPINKLFSPKNFDRYGHIIFPMIVIAMALVLLYTTIKQLPL